MAVHDDLATTDRLRVHRHDGGGSWSPPLDPTEALHHALVDFVGCVASGGTPRADGEAGWRVVRILEAASASLADRGRPVDLPW